MTGRWVVCAPGDPTEDQWAKVLKLASGDPFCAERWNEDTGAVAVVIERANGAHDYIVYPNGAWIYAAPAVVA
jgi:hypothetical protein